MIRSASDSSRGRRGRLSGGALAALGSLVALVVIATRLFAPAPDPAAAETLVLHCAAGIRGPVEELARSYEAEYGTRVELHLGGSGTLLGGLIAAPLGDLFLAGDASFIARAREHGLVREEVTLATMSAVIGVRAGTDADVDALVDLTRSDLRVGLGDPEASAVGRVTREALHSAGLWEAVRANVRVLKPTVGDLANDLSLGSLDVAVIWDATAAQIEGLEARRVPAFEEARRDVTIAVLAASHAPQAALRFARYLAASDTGAPVFARHGFTTPTDGDPFDPRPRIVLMGGAMLHAAVEDTIAEFARREGVQIERIYNGCGLLVAQMRAGRVPDAYISCDVSFLDMVDEHFEPGRVLSANRMVLLVPLGNPRGIAALEDLLQEGLRVGLAHPEKSALGALSQARLEAAGLAARLDASGNVKVTSPTGDFLVNQLRTGALDVALVYASNAAMALDEVERVPLSIPGARAVQPMAIAVNSPHKELLERLYAELTSAVSRARFEELGFEWMSQEPGEPVEPDDGDDGR